MLLILPPVSVPGHKLQKPRKSRAYFSRFAPLMLFFFTKRQGQKGEHGSMFPLPPNYAPEKCQPTFPEEFFSLIPNQRTVFVCHVRFKRYFKFFTSVNFSKRNCRTANYLCH